MKLWSLLSALLLVALATTSVDAQSRVAIARPAEGSAAWKALVADFEAANPGYRLHYAAPLGSLRGQSTARVAFVQEGTGAALARRADGTVEMPDPALTVGDVVVVRPGDRVDFQGDLEALVIDVPDLPGADVPTFVRPDWDPKITDTPGGCAEETGAYRRILLTWLGEVGPYLFHGLNAHRVRITDSFSHYHPVEGGFDEFYLVQMVQPGARLVTSEQVGVIERPQEVTLEQSASLLTYHDVEVGDLVYLPRGTVHRGMGGILAQVITAPGFRPRAEIGVDHHLRAINERLGLAGESALPFNAVSSLEAVVK